MKIADLVKYQYPTSDPGSLVTPDDADDADDADDEKVKMALVGADDADDARMMRA